MYSSGKIRKKFFNIPKLTKKIRKTVFVASWTSHHSSKLHYIKYKKVTKIGHIKMGHKLDLGIVKEVHLRVPLKEWAPKDVSQ